MAPTPPEYRLFDCLMDEESNQLTRSARENKLIKQGEQNIQMESLCLSIYTFDYYGCFDPVDVWTKYGVHEGVAGTRDLINELPPYMVRENHGQHARNTHATQMQHACDTCNTGPRRSRLG